MNWQLIESMFRSFLTAPCHECGEVRVWFWHKRCDFCDCGEGQISSQTK